MRYKKVLILIFIALVFSGCIEEITGRFQKVQIVFVNVSVMEKDNRTIIQNIEARGEEIPKIYAPGHVLPEKFPAIYAEVMQVYNISRPETLKKISFVNGQPYNGTGNYTFAVQLTENALNKSQPMFVQSVITYNATKRLARARVAVNWTE